MGSSYPSAGLNIILVLENIVARFVKMSWLIFGGTCEIYSVLGRLRANARPMRATSNPSVYSGHWPRHHSYAEQVQFLCAVGISRTLLLNLEVSYRMFTDALFGHQNIWPIFTMAIPGAKIYIVIARGLVQAMQKVPKALSSAPIEVNSASKVCGSCKETHRILMNNVNGDERDWRPETAYGVIRSDTSFTHIQSLARQKKLGYNTIHRNFVSVT